MPTCSLTQTPDAPVDPLLEGIRDLSQPCSLSLIVPGLLVFLSARRRQALVLLGVVASTWVVGWMKAADWLPGLPHGVLAVAVGLGFLGSGWTAWKRRSQLSGLLAGLIAGGLSTWLWAPCVGTELATILNTAPDAPVSQLLPMGLFVLGLSLPLLAIALLPIVFPRLVRFETPVSNAALALVVFVGLAIMIDWYDDVVIQLNRWSVGAT